MRLRTGSCNARGHWGVRKQGLEAHVNVCAVVAEAIRE